MKNNLKPFVLNYLKASGITESRLISIESDLTTILNSDKFIAYEKDCDESLDLYYKDNTSNSKSIKIESNKDFKDFIKRSSSEKLKQRFLTDKTASRYVKSKNYNFFNINEETFELEAVSYNNAVKLNIFLLLSYTGIRNILPSNIFRSIFKTYSEDFRYWANDYYSYYRYTLDTAIKIKSSLNEKDNLVILKNLRRRLQQEKEYKNNCLIAILNGIKEPYTVSTVINSTFDINDDLSLKLKTISNPVKKEFTNPVSGFVSIKTVRVLKEGLTDECLLNKTVKEYAELNKSFEFFADYVKKLKLNNEVNVFLIEGPLVKYYYNVNNYNNASYYDDLKRGLYNTRNGGGGTLWGSCMRYDNTNSRMEFYEKNPKNIKLLIAKKKGINTLTARAVTYYDDVNDKYYVNRIFYQKESDLLAMLKYIEERDNFYSCHENDYRKMKSTKAKVDFKIYMTPNYSSRRPYFDDMSGYLYSDKKGTYMKDNVGNAEMITKLDLISKHGLELSRNKKIANRFFTESLNGYIAKNSITIKGSEDNVSLNRDLLSNLTIKDGFLYYNASKIQNINEKN